jgi:hypothetical protein
MAYFLTVTIGFLLCLGMIGGVFVYFLSLGLKSNDKAESIKQSVD